MPIAPKHKIADFGETSISSERQFTDRIEYISAFRKKLLFEDKNTGGILHFFGVGGIGKSSLRKEFGRILYEDYPDTIWSYADFEIQAFREAETSLYHLRKNLKEKYKVEFSTFDIAYTVYWQKTHPQITIAKENLPFLEEGSLVSDLLAGASGIPFIGLLPSIAKTVYKGQKQFKNWWIKRGQKELYDLTSLSPKEILERLPLYFALDLKDHLESNSQKAVIFIDTYEALWENFNLEGGFFLRDEWLRELIAQLPSVLWIIFGREKIRWHELDKDWESYIEQHLLEGLTETDSSNFLNSCGISDKKIQKAIIASSRGVPHYLDLAVDTYLQIKLKNQREPLERDFAKTQKEVLVRFLRYLDKNEIETLKVLSAARSWDVKVFRLLVDEFKTGYPISALNVLCRFSFINKAEDSESFVLHDLVRQGLLDQMDNETKISIHNTLFRYYCSYLPDEAEKQITEVHCRTFKEAFYHGKFSLKPAELQQWFSKTKDAFNTAAKWQILNPLYEELIKIIETTLGKNTAEFALTVTYYSSVLYNLGRYKQALKLIEENFAILKDTLGENDIRYASLLNNLATIFYYRGELNRSKELYKQVIEIRKKNLGENHRHYADAIDNLAVLYNDTGDHEAAIKLHKQAAEIYKNTLGEEHVHYADALNNLATSYLSIEKYDEAIMIFEKARRIVVKSAGENHPRYASALNHIGRANYFKGDFEKALAHYKNAYSIRVELLGENHPSTAQSILNMGQVYHRINEFNRSIEMYEKALDIFRNTVGEKHFNFADAVSLLGDCYLSMDQPEKALEYFKNAEGLYIQIFGEEHSSVQDIRKRTEALSARLNSSS